MPELWFDHRDAVPERARTLKETLVLTVASGFIGSHLLQALADSGRNVAIICRSFSDTQRIRDLLGRVRRIDLDIQDLARALPTTSLLGLIYAVADYGRTGNDAAGVCQANLLLPVKILGIAIRSNSVHPIAGTSKKS